MRIASTGQMVFALILVALGVQGMRTGAFTAVWGPVPKAVPAREVLVYGSAAVSLASGLGLLAKRTGAVAARLLLASLLLWFLVFHLLDIARAPATFPPWDGAAETLSIVAGAWVLYAWFATSKGTSRPSFAAGDAGVRIARVLYALASIVFGLAHFIYAKETASLVPHWLPAPMAWAYLTGSAFLAAGVAIAVGVCARLAAVLSTIQLALFTLLVWVPIVASGSKNPFDWSEFALSAAITAAGWLVADSYRSSPWLGFPKRALSAPAPALPL